VPVVLHIFAASVFSALGAFQFSAEVRNKKPRWHRRAGAILIVCGLVAASSGLWMTLFYPWPEGDGPLLYGMRLVVGSAMFASIVFAVAAIRRRDFADHGAWMTRAYALGIGAGTQFVVHVLWLPFFGKPGELARALLMGGAWAVNAIIAEWIIRRRRSTRPKATSQIVAETPRRTCWGSRSPRAARSR
jgi:hypothetical protein